MQLVSSRRHYLVASLRERDNGKVSRSSDAKGAPAVVTSGLADLQGLIIALLFSCHSRGLVGGVERECLLVVARPDSRCYVRCFTYCITSTCKRGAIDRRLARSFLPLSCIEFFNRRPRDWHERQARTVK